MTADARQAGAARRGRGVDDPPLLVEAKLGAPGRRRGGVDRPRIQRALEGDGDAVLTLVAAPAGYGKTTAVSDWCAANGPSLAWVTLDSGDNDPGRLWRYVATAVDRVRGGLGRSALQRLSVTGSPIENVVDELMNAVATYEIGLVIVLDDLHAVTDAECLASIDHALLHLPVTARIVATTRVDPALGLARMRASGQLVELRASELAFTPAEARELLVVRGGIPLGSEEIDLLVERTEGWPAALVLAGLWLQTVDDPARAVRAFGGDQRFVADYLSSEVLASLDEDRRSFLEGVAVLGEFTADLCDAVLGRADSAAELAELERANLFVSRLERGEWFRIHALFAEYAQAQLASSDATAATRIHRRAAEWLASQQLPIEAIGHAAAGGEQELVARLLADGHLALIRHGASRTILRWARTLSSDCIVRHPELAVAAATAAVLTGGSTIEQRRYLRLAEQAHVADSNVYVASAVSMVRALTIEGGVQEAVRHGRRAVELAESGSDDLLTAALATCARALYFAGELDEASATAARVLEHPDIDHRGPSLTYARTTLALVAVERGRLAAARSHAEQAKAVVGRIGTSRSWLGANAAAAFGAVLAAEGDLVEAERELATAEHLFREEAPTQHHTWVLLSLARVELRRGRLAEAETALRAAREAIDDLTDSGFLPGLADEVGLELDEAKARANSGEVLELPSAAELEVLRLLVTDLSTREIGERLFLSPNTIRSHKRALYHKLGVHTRADAIARATTLGLLGEAQSPG